MGRKSGVPEGMPSCPARPRRSSSALPEGRWTGRARGSTWPQCTARWAGRTRRSPSTSARTTRWSGYGWPRSTRGHLRHPPAEEPGPAQENVAQDAPEDHGGGAQGAAGGRLRRQLLDVQLAVPVRQGKAGSRPHVRGSRKGPSGRWACATRSRAPSTPLRRAPRSASPTRGRRRRSWRRAAGTGSRSCSRTRATCRRSRTGMR